MSAEQERLLFLAKQLRDAATAANRADVVAQVDDVILLLAGRRPGSGDEKSNVVVRILDGLGL